MNGLRFIRTKCNISASELGEILGVTRQAISSWENGNKEIPTLRLSQLSEYFGLEFSYFGDISEEDVNELAQKAMYLYEINGKETYSFRPYPDESDFINPISYFDKDQILSLNDEYKLAKKKKQETLARIEEIIDWNDSLSLSNKSMITNRNCDIYNMICDLMVFLRAYDPLLKVPLLHEMRSVWKAMLLAFDLMDKSELEYKNNTEYTFEDGDWIISLSEQIKNHWDTEKNFHTKLIEVAFAKRSKYDQT